MPLRFVIIGGGPAGVAAATHAARLGAEVVVIDRDIIGGAANLWDCVPSKAMIATGAAITRADASASLGFQTDHANVDLEQVRQRIEGITQTLSNSATELLTSQNVSLVKDGQTDRRARPWRRRPPNTAIQRQRHPGVHRFSASDPEFAHA